jgi:hypothetical protein
MTVTTVETSTVAVTFKTRKGAQAWADRQNRSEIVYTLSDGTKVQTFASVVERRATERDAKGLLPQVFDGVWITVPFTEHEVCNICGQTVEETVAYTSGGVTLEGACAPCARQETGE